MWGDTGRYGASSSTVCRAPAAPRESIGHCETPSSSEPACSQQVRCEEAPWCEETPPSAEPAAASSAASPPIAAISVGSTSTVCTIPAAVAPRWRGAMPAPTLGARERMAHGACRPTCSARWRRRRRKRRPAAPPPTPCTSHLAAASSAPPSTRRTPAWRRRCPSGTRGASRRGCLGEGSEKVPRRFREGSRRFLEDA